MPDDLTASQFPRSAEIGLSFRPESEADRPFLERLYAGTRAPELALMTGWSDEMKSAFLAQQFAAQSYHYKTFYPAAEWLILERDEEPIGRLYLEEWSREWRVIDIALLPAQCGKGLGTAILSDIFDRAAAAGKAVSIHVEKMNPARRLYERLGFRRVEDKEIYDLMEWHSHEPAEPAEAEGS